METTKEMGVRNGLHLSTPPALLTFVLSHLGEVTGLSMKKSYISRQIGTKIEYACQFDFNLKLDFLAQVDCSVITISNS